MIHKAKTIRQQVDSCTAFLKEKIYTPVLTLALEGAVTPEPVPYEQRLSLEYRPYHEGDCWGKLFDCAWFHVTGKIPESLKGKKLVLKLDFNGEGLLFDSTGCPVRGITNVTSQYDYSLGMPGKRIVQFTEKSNGNETVDLWIDAACNDLFGEFKGDGKIADAKVCICDDTARELYYDITVLNDLLDCIDPESPQYYTILYALENAENELSCFTQEEYRRALQFTKEQLNKKGPEQPALNFCAVGHAHIDLAWLWPIRETKRKGARTFSTQLEMLARNPDYVFGASQPQLYEWVKENYPPLYEKIRKAVAQGRWELQGGMWVEPDTNIPSGESLVRQFLYGQNFFRREFGQTMKILWLPDVFGYNGNLPQIMKKCGCDYFLTIKLSWNQINRFPYHTFNWKGIDGSEVLAHMPPEGTYGSAAMPHSVMKAAKNYQEKGICDSAMMLYGISDGGGGCGPEHMERIQRIRNLPDLYPVRPGKCIDFFEHISKNRKAYPTYKGELFFEMHYGVATGQANNKKFNRKGEIAFHNTELLCTCAHLLRGMPYPKEQLDALWKEFLLYQFHDILPGSSIRRVYEESCARYAVILEQLNALRDEAAAALAKTEQKAYFNPLPWARDEVIGGRLYHAEPFGCAKEQSAAPHLAYGEDFMENDAVIVRFGPKGSILSYYDKKNERELFCADAPGNQLNVYTDIGNAWDISLNYREKRKYAFEQVSVSTQCSGHTVCRTSEYRFGNSVLTQKVMLHSGGRLLEFDTTVDWHEKDRMLRAEFPLEIGADFVTCDIQFGSIRRPTTENNSLEYAQMELPVHKYADLSDREYGAALINDCKYGYYAKNGMLSINLLRSQNYPGESADIGVHHFRYALYPHEKDLYASDVIQKSYCFNYTMPEIAQVENLPLFAQPVQENLIPETVKMDETVQDVIVRIYESSGQKTNAEIRLDPMFERCVLTNMIEDDCKELPVQSGSIRLQFNPYEVHTLRLILKK